VVFVLDRHGKALMPCSEKRARLLLARERARVHRIVPFVIRLVDREAGTCDLQALRLKLDPGSKTTGIALMREDGGSQHVLNLFELTHRGQQISEALTARRAMRRRRRGNLRYREARFDNRTRAEGWLAPSLQHRVDTTMDWVKRLSRWTPLTAISQELVKFSSNWKKEKSRIQKIHSRVTNARRDFLHKTSTAISKNHAMIAIEDLQVRNMSRSAVGNIEKPGRNVRAKSGLNKAILDQGWFEFRRQLDYKLTWNGGWLIAVPPQNTSRTCPACGHVSADNRKTQARFECVECGHEDNADVVGAINVLRAGHARLACEVNGAIMPSAAGTRRSDSGAVQCRA